MEAIIVLLVAAVIAIGFMIAKAKGAQRVTAPLTAVPQTAAAQTHPGKSYPFSEITSDSNLLHVSSIHTKIRGVTYENSDGAQRQQIIRDCCNSGDALCLEREPNNPFDHNAIKVRRSVYSNVPEDKPRPGELIGYVSRELAEDLARKVDHDGFVLMAWIKNVTGGEDKKSFGVNIQIEEYRPARQQGPVAKRRQRKKCDTDTSNTVLAEDQSN